MISNVVTSTAKLSEEVKALETMISQNLPITDGIVSGFEVTVIGMIVSVGSGAIVVSGSYFEFPGIDNVSFPRNIGTSGFLVARKTQVPTYANDDFGVSQVASIDLQMSVQFVAWPNDGDVTLAYLEVVTQPAFDEEGNQIFQRIPTNGNIQVRVPNEGPFVVDLRLQNLELNYVVRDDNTPFSYTPDDPIANQYRLNLGTAQLVFNPANANDILLVNGSYEISVDEIRIELDSSSKSYEFIRKPYTNQDIHHVSSVSSSYQDNANPHGLTFRDISFNTPLHSKLFDRGFAVYNKTDIENVPGTFTEQTFSPFQYTSNAVVYYRYDIDWFGYETGVVGAQFIKLKHIPLRVAYVVDINTNKPLMFDVKNDCIVFDASTQYSAVPVKIGYTFIADYEPKVNGTAIEISPPSDSSAMVALSQGQEIVLKSTQDTIADLGKFNSVPCIVNIGMDENGTVKYSPDILDASLVTSRSSSQFQSPKKVDAQVAITLRGSPLKNALKPPSGFLKLLTPLDSFYGRRRFLYTYTKKYTTLYVTQNAVQDIPEGHNLDGAVIYRNDEVLDRSAWEFVGDRQQIVIANDVFEEIPNSTYRLVVNDFTSARNRRGYFEFVGTAEAPVGPKAKCTLVSQKPLQNGDTFQIISNDGSVTKTYYQSGSAWYGDTPLAIAQSIANCFSDDLLMNDLNITCEAQGSKVVFNVGGLADATLSVNVSQALVRVYPIDGSSGTLDILGSDFNIGDSITLSVGSNPSITKTFASKSGFTDTSLNPYQTIADAFSELQDKGFVFEVSTDKLVVTSGDIGSVGNTNQFVAPYWFTVSGFSGGLDTKPPGFSDVSGAILQLIDEQELDVTGEFSIYCTDNLDAGGSEDIYKLVATVPQSTTSTTFTLDSENFTSKQYDVSNDFKLVVALYGKDQGGSEVNEEITITPMNFCEYSESDNGKFNELQFVRSKNVYGELSQWDVVEKNNIGQSEVVILTEVTSGVRDYFDIAEVEWTGEGIKRWKDIRNFIPNMTSVDPSFVVAETVSTLSNLYN